MQSKAAPGGAGLLRRARSSERRDDPSPPDDLITYLIDADVDGAPLPPKHMIGILYVLLLAGIDTTWSSLGSSLWHLATHPDDLARLVAEPELMPTAVEEMLRLYAPATMARIVDRRGRGRRPHALPRRAGAAAVPGRQPRPRASSTGPTRPCIDRTVNRHTTFGLGIHRCLGSNLARMELQVGLEEWLAAFPSFRLTPGAEVVWNGGQVRGPSSVPVLIDGLA